MLPISVHINVGVSKHNNCDNHGLLSRNTWKEPRLKGAGDLGGDSARIFSMRVTAAASCWYTLHMLIGDFNMAHTALSIYHSRDQRGGGNTSTPWLE